MHLTGLCVHHNDRSIRGVNVEGKLAVVTKFRGSGLIGHHAGHDNGEDDFHGTALLVIGLGAQTRTATNGFGDRCTAIILHRENW